MLGTGIPGASIKHIAVNKVLLYWIQVILSVRCSVDRVIARVSYVAFNIVRFMTGCCVISLKNCAPKTWIIEN